MRNLEHYTTALRGALASAAGGAILATGLATGLDLGGPRTPFIAAGAAVGGIATLLILFFRRVP